MAVKSPGPNDDGGKGRFYGALSSKVRQGMKLGGNKVDRSGYAGIRSKVRSGLLVLTDPTRLPRKGGHLTMSILHTVPSITLWPSDVGYITVHIPQDQGQAIARRGDAVLC